MKNNFRKIIFTLFFSVSLISAKAQYVTIPDPSFVIWLNSHGFSGCMNANQLDTTCNDVLITTYIDCNSSNISDLTGITYFDNLTTLFCGSNQLTALPVLPATLTTLLCYDNQISYLTLPPALVSLGLTFNDLSVLPTLPSTLKFLECEYNSLSVLPALPFSLRYLKCSNNVLDSLPTLPDSLASIDCSYNDLLDLPALPLAMTNLDCEANILTTLPTLPATLLFLKCGYNNITSLPALPPTLRSLSCEVNHLSFMSAFTDSIISIRCENNPLTSLPTLPPNLRELYCSNCQLTSLPALPSSLAALVCLNNQLTSLPALSDSLHMLNCQNNQLTTIPALPVSLLSLNCGDNQLTTIPALPVSLSSLYCTNNQLTSLPALPDTLDYLWIQFNPDLTCLPPISVINNDFEWFGTGISCIPNVMNVANAYPSVDTVPICNLNNPGNCPVNWNIKGNIYTDSNNNCILENGESLNGNIKISLFKGGILQQQTFSDQAGRYSFVTDTGNYTYSIDTAGMYFTAACPPSFYHTSVITTANAYDYDKDFSIACKPGFDVGAQGLIRRQGAFRPGTFVDVAVLAGDMNNFYNLHCAAGVSGTVAIIINGPASFSSIAPGSLTPFVNGDTLIYTVTDFDSVDILNDFGFILYVDSTALVGNQICFDIAVTPVAGDNEVSNNIKTYCVWVVNSYDPNEKEVDQPVSMDTSQHWLTYTIHFQNTGNAPALHIYILDTLDDNLDESSIQLLTYSHEPIVQVINKKVVFDFANINLPDSLSDEPHSHGYVQYKVKRNDNLPLGTQIRNTAYIYFDFNTPVVTNTTINQLTLPSGILSYGNNDSQFLIYPNPLSAGNTLNLFYNSGSQQKATMNIYELSGRKVYSSSINSSSQSQQITLPDLAQGIYQCVIDGVEGSAHQKLVIVK